MKIIVFTGPESSGKSYASSYLAQRYNFELVPEIARTHLDQYGPKYTYETIEDIAKRHIKKENNLKQTFAGKNVVLDTDLLTLYIWSQDKYEKVSPYIREQLLQHTEQRLYVLCKPDIDWEYDPLRENTYDRDRLFDLYLQELDVRSLPYTILSGTYEERDSFLNNMVQSLF